MIKEILWTIIRPILKLYYRPLGGYETARLEWLMMGQRVGQDNPHDFKPATVKEYRKMLRRWVVNK